MTKILRAFDHVIAPSGVLCMCCDELSYGEYLCANCCKSLRAMRLPAEEAGNGDVRSVYRYDGTAKELVILLKGDLLSNAAHALAEGMADALKEMAIPSDTVMTWVTMPEIRRKERGIDHGRELCEAVACRTGLTARQLLVRKGRIHTQRGLNQEKRLRNLQGTFLCEEKLNGPVLLIDDVLTTGATASACAEALMAAGATRVFVLTATKAILKRESIFERLADQYGLHFARMG